MFFSVNEKMTKGDNVYATRIYLFYTILREYPPSVKKVYVFRKVYVKNQDRDYSLIFHNV